MKTVWFYNSDAKERSRAWPETVVLQAHFHLDSSTPPAGTRFISFGECRSGAFHLPPVNFPPLPTKHMQYALLLVETRIIFDNIWGLVGRSNNNPRLVGLPQPPPRCYLMGSGLVPLQPFGGDERRHGRHLQWHQIKKTLSSVTMVAFLPISSSMVNPLVEETGIGAELPMKPSSGLNSLSRDRCSLERAPDPQHVGELSGRSQAACR